MTHQDPLPTSRFVRSLALSGGRLALRYRKNLEVLKVDSKGVKDIVTEADRAVERLIRRKITTRFPHHSIVGEEEGGSAGDQWNWSIDPIDGTVSFARGHHQFGISVAVKWGEETRIGAVYMPALGELYLAEKGKGATMNGKPIHVSSRNRLDEAVMATGFACLRGQSNRNNMAHFARILPHLLSIRRYGSAAYDLVMVACGKLEGFWELGLNPWDVDAGILIVREAGGIVTDFSGKSEALPGELVAGNPLLHEPLRKLLSQD